MKHFNAKQFTTASKQLESKRIIHAPIEQVWEVVADHQGMTAWMPYIKQVDLVKPDDQGTYGEGAERHCQFGNDLLQEKIVHWDPPYGYAYAISDMHLVNDHVGYISLTEKLDGIEVRWQQYFVPQGNAFKKWMAKNFMFPRLMNKALQNLEKQVLTNQQQSA